MTIQWILDWSSLVFVAPFAVALLYLGLMTLSGIGLGDGDADMDGGA